MSLVCSERLRITYLALGVQVCLTDFVLSGQSRVDCLQTQRLFCLSAALLALRISLHNGSLRFWPAESGLGFAGSMFAAVR